MTTTSSEYAHSNPIDIFQAAQAGEEVNGWRTGLLDEPTLLILQAQEQTTADLAAWEDTRKRSVSPNVPVVAIGSSSVVGSRGLEEGYRDLSIGLQEVENEADVGQYDPGATTWVDTQFPTVAKMQELQRARQAVGWRTPEGGRMVFAQLVGGPGAHEIIVVGVLDPASGTLQAGRVALI
jgi:hypothetical protein